jgi:threonine/homoserine/homoserine lactone efflux protein
VDLALLLKGIAIGFSIAAPVGPIGVLCIRRTLTAGPLAGLATGLGAATADAAYGAVAAFGLTIVSSFLVDQGAWLRLVGGGFLCYLGVRTPLSTPAADASPVRTMSLAAAYVSTLALTLTNPATILSFVAVFAGLGAGLNASGGAAVLVVGGVFAGSTLWWLILSGGVSLVRSRFDAIARRWVNRLSGVVVTGFGIAALWSALPHPIG